jgi:hypothetical protein
MRRAFVISGIVTALIGVTIILPALANYGRPGALVGDAVRALVIGSVVVAAGGGALWHGLRKRSA